MKVSCNGLDLSDAVAKVSKALTTRTTAPILEGIKIKAEGSTLTLLATDLELAIEKRIVADVLIEGETVVPGRLFADFVKKLDHDRIELCLSDSNKLNIKYNDSVSDFQCFNAIEYPQVKEIVDAEYFSVVKCDFRDLVSKVAFSVSMDESRPILKGVLLEIDDESVTGVALDGYRLAKCVKPIEKTTAKMSAVVPARCLTEISKLIDDNTDTVNISIQKNYMLVDLQHTKITTRLLDGDFISYRQIIPKEFNSSVTVNRSELEDALERAMLVAKQDKNNLVKFDIRENIMQVSSKSEQGEVNEKMAVKLSGVDITVAFNARYFTELLRYIDSDNIVIKLITPVNPCIIVPSSGGGGDFMYLVLPVRLV